MTGSTFRVGLVQTRASRSPAANLEAVIKLIGEAKTDGADYVQTPEMTNLMEVSRDKLFASIVPEESDASLAAFRELARKLSIQLHIGSLAVRGHARQGGQPRIPDRPTRRDRRAVRQDPHVRRRSRQWRKLPRVAELPRRRTGRAA